jgi:IS30 family transposase
VGIPTPTGYLWAKSAGVVLDRTTHPRKYTQEEKARFLAALDRLNHIPSASREAGIPRDVGANWAAKVGFEARKAWRDRKALFHKLRADGLHQAEARRRVGVSTVTASFWDQGIRKIGGKLIRPDGSLRGYKDTVASQVTPQVMASMRAIETVIDPRYLSLQEREMIRDLSSSGSGVRNIATVMARSPSTISRELRRNLSQRGTYEPYAAHRVAAGRRPRPKPSKLVAPSPLREFVEDKLGEDWSPEQISHALIKDYPTDQEMRVSPETIYQGLYLQARGGLKRELQTALRTGRTRRKPHRTGQERRPRFIDPMLTIAERPPEIEDRAVPGHWEGDLITGKLNQTAIATLVERQTRYVMLVHLPGGHTAEEVRDGLVATMSTLPAHLRGSLTWDQGSEMANHKSFTIATDMDVYFCDPASPWQRGSNENTNGLLRQYFPKGSDLSHFSPADLEHVAQKLNGRPRKTLDWDNPAERFRDLLLST